MYPTKEYLLGKSTFKGPCFFFDLALITKLKIELTLMFLKIKICRSQILKEYWQHFQPLNTAHLKVISKNFFIKKK